MGNDLTAEQIARLKPFNEKDLEGMSRFCFYLTDNPVSQKVNRIVKEFAKVYEPTRDAIASLYHKIFG